MLDVLLPMALLGVAVYVLARRPCGEDNSAVEES
jgi:hypothetical protein